MRFTFQGFLLGNTFIHNYELARISGNYKFAYIIVYKKKMITIRNSNRPTKYFLYSWRKSSASIYKWMHRCIDLSSYK
jgi:hypothetical protein